MEPEQHQKRSISEIHAGLGRSALSSAMMSLLRFSTGPGSPPEGDHFSLRELSFLHPFFLFFVRAPEHILLPLHRPGFSAVQLSFYVFSPLFRSSHSFNVLLLSSHITYILLALFVCLQPHPVSSSVAISKSRKKGFISSVTTQPRRLSPYGYHASSRIPGPPALRNPLKQPLVFLS